MEWEGTMHCFVKDGIEHWRFMACERLAEWVMGTCDDGNDGMVLWVEGEKITLFRVVLEREIV